MAFDFPNLPTIGQQVTAPGGSIFTWDGTKWAASSVSTGVGEAPTDGAVYSRLGSTASWQAMAITLASPPAIGTTAAAAGKFTTLTATSTTTLAAMTSSGITASPISGSTGSFTTLAASSTVSGAGFTAYLASPPAIGGTAAAAGAFTTVTASSTITPSQTSGIVGTNAANNANAGSVGEYLSASPGAITLTSLTLANAATLVLTAGDWDVDGFVSYSASGNNLQLALASLSTISVTAGANQSGVNPQGTTLNAYFGCALAPLRVSAAGGTTVYCVVQGQFASGTTTATGFIRARRIR